jgi:phage terminase small subunit
MKCHDEERTQRKQRGTLPTNLKVPPDVCALPTSKSRRSEKPLTNGNYEHFAHLVAKGSSPAKAYVLCGYSKNGALQSGNRLLRKPDVAARVEELKRAVSERQVEKIAVERAWVVAVLVENVQRAMQVEPVRDREGNTNGQYTYQGSVANKALELLGKELGMFQTKQENSDTTLDAVIKRLHAGRERVAMMQRRDAASADSPILLSRESQPSPIVGAEKGIATDESIAEPTGPGGLTWPAS